MILAVLALAAQLSIAPATDTPRANPPPTERTPNLYRAPEGCGDIQRRVSNDQRETLKKLGRLPNGIAQYAVARTVQGCPVAAPVGYHPSALPGAADAPAMREDAPSNRR